MKTFSDSRNESAISPEIVLYQPRVGNMRLSRESYDSKARPDDVIPERSRFAIEPIGVGCNDALENRPVKPLVDTATSSSVYVSRRRVSSAIR